LSNVATLLDVDPNSIESQVLQSNPILESFGNAKIVRNDNSTAAPEDFEITNSGTYDVEMARRIRKALPCFAKCHEYNEIPCRRAKGHFAITVAILHASNLTFNDHGKPSSLDDNNVHVEPVCYLRGVTPTDLNHALCFSATQARRETQVHRSLPLFKAQKA
jgi:myosin heavy subunit